MRTKPYKITPEQKILIENIIAGKNITDACEAAGVARSSYYDWYDDKDFRREIEKAKDSRVHAVEDMLFKKCEEGDTTAIKFFLCNRAKERWQDVGKMQVGFGSEVDKTLERAAQVIKALEGKGGKNAE